MSSTTQLQVKMYSQSRVYFEGVADSVSASSRLGPFDVLSGHANFFTLLVPGEVTIKNADHVKIIEISQGIVQVSDDYVKVFVDV